MLKKLNLLLSVWYKLGKRNDHINYRPTITHLFSLLLHRFAKGLVLFQNYYWNNFPHLFHRSLLSLEWCQLELFCYITEAYCLFDCLFVLFCFVFLNCDLIKQNASKLGRTNFELIFCLLLFCNPCKASIGKFHRVRTWSFIGYPP